MKKESMRMKKDIRAYEYEELQKELERLGEKPFRAKQIYEWLHVKLADRFDEMTNLSVKLREKLAEERKEKLNTPKRSANLLCRLTGSKKI